MVGLACPTFAQTAVPKQKITRKCGPGATREENCFWELKGSSNAKNAAERQMMDRFLRARKARTGVAPTPQEASRPQLPVQQAQPMPGEMDFASPDLPQTVDMPQPAVLAPAPLEASAPAAPMPVAAPAMALPVTAAQVSAAEPPLPLAATQPEPAPLPVEQAPAPVAAVPAPALDPTVEAKLNAEAAVELDVAQVAKDGQIGAYRAASEAFKPLTTDELAQLTPEDLAKYVADAQKAGAYEGYVAQNIGFIGADLQARMADPAFRHGFEASLKQPVDAAGQFAITQPVDTGRSQAEIRATGGIGNVPGALPGGKEQAAINSGFGESVVSSAPFNYGRNVKAVAGEGVKTSADGTVAMVTPEGNGQVSVIVDHGNGFKTIFRHMDASSALSAGSPVEDDKTVVGRVAAQQNEIHYEVWKDGAAVNLNTYDPVAYANRCSVACDTGLPEHVLASTPADAGRAVWNTPAGTSMPNRAEVAQAKAEAQLAPTASQQMASGAWPATPLERSVLAIDYLREKQLPEPVVKETVAIMNRDNATWDVYLKGSAPQAQLDGVAQSVQAHYQDYAQGKLQGCENLSFATCTYMNQYMSAGFSPKRADTRTDSVISPAAAPDIQPYQTGGLSQGNAYVPQLKTLTLGRGQHMQVVGQVDGIFNVFTPAGTVAAAQGVTAMPESYAFRQPVSSLPAAPVAQPVAAIPQPAAAPQTADYVPGSPVRGADLVMLGLNTIDQVEGFCKQPDADLYLKNKDLAQAVCHAG